MRKNESIVFNGFKLGFGFFLFVGLLFGIAYAVGYSHFTLFRLVDFE